MSDQSLQDAFVAELRRHGVDEFQEVRGIAQALARIAAAYPAEPAPEIVVDHRPGETCSVVASVDPETGFSRQPSDAAVEAAARVFYGGAYGAVGDEGNKLLHDGAQSALEAAYRVDAPRPLLDRAAVSRRLTEIIDGSMETGALPRNDLLDAVMELARPMPTREQIAEALHDEDNAHSWRSLGICSDWCYDLYLKRAGAVLALLNGAG